MVEKYYLDTSIWRDYYENRSDGLRPLGEWAFQFLKRVIAEGDIVLYSYAVVRELSKEYSDEIIAQIFEVLNAENLLLKVDISDVQKREAAKLCKSRDIPFGDALHAILARDNGAIMIARDRHFFELIDIVEIRKPEDLI